MRVFEFGAGHSTLWWAARVASVISVESDPAWIAKLRPQLPANAKIRHVPLDVDGVYARAAEATGERFDIIVIDGFDRNHCAFHCLDSLKQDGVIVWDNSDWEDRFHDGLAFLAAQGFARLDFSGIGPLNGYGWCTSVFYRRAAGNSLGI